MLYKIKKKRILFVSFFLVLNTQCSEVDLFNKAPEEIFFKIVGHILKDVYQSPIKDLKQSTHFVRFKKFSPDDQLKNEIAFSILKTLSFISKKNASETHKYVETELKKFCSHEDIFRYQIETNKTLFKNSLFSHPEKTNRNYYDLQIKIFQAIQWITFNDNFLQYLETSLLSPYLQKSSAYVFAYSSNVMNNTIFNFLCCNKGNSVHKILLDMLKNVNFKKFPWLKLYIESNGKEISKPLAIRNDQSMNLNYSETRSLQNFLNQNKITYLNKAVNIAHLLKSKKKYHNYKNCKKKYYTAIMGCLIVLHSLPKKKKNARIRTFLKQVSNHHWYNKI